MGGSVVKGDQPQEPGSTDALAGGLSLEEMTRVGWVPGSEVIAVEPHATRLGALGMFIALAVAALLHQYLEVSLLWPLLTALVVKLALDRHSSHHAYLLLLPDRAVLWARMPVLGTLIRERECRWAEVQWLRDRQRSWHPCEAPRRRELAVGWAGGELALSGSALVSVEDWARLKETIIRKAGLGDPKHVVERSWCAKDEYIEYRRVGSDSAGRDA